MLFLLPMVTMRTYSEEKRSGTIELLLTSPVTDFQIILGKFLGAMALYAVMLGGHADSHRRCCSSTARPEWKPILTAYLGLLLMGGCFISLGLFISSLTSNQIVAGMVTFAVFLLLWVITWIGSAAGPQVENADINIGEFFMLPDDTRKRVGDSWMLVGPIGLFILGDIVDEAALHRL